jgi:hypothetical protein
MMDFIKMAVLGAALSYAVVSAYQQPMQKLEAALVGGIQNRAQPDEDSASAAAARSSDRQSGTLRISAIAMREASNIAPAILTADR